MFAATYNCDPDKADENRQRPARTAMSHSPKKASDVGVPSCSTRTPAYRFP